MRDRNKSRHQKQTAYTVGELMASQTVNAIYRHLSDLVMNHKPPQNVRFENVVLQPQLATEKVI